MKKISSALKSHLRGQVTTTANCWLVTLKDGSKLGFTDHNNNISYKGVEYRCGESISMSSVESCNSLSADNFEIDFVLNPSFISQEDLLEGRYYKAYIEYFVINYMDHTQGSLLIKAGYVHELRLFSNKFSLEVMGIGYELNKQTQSIYSGSCRAKFKDKKCGARDIDYVISGEITNILNNDVVEIDSSISFPNIYRNSEIQFLSDSKSKMVGLVTEVIGSRVILQKNSDIILKKGLRFLLYPQCDKEFFTCCNIYHNSLNFRGEPHVPGVDEVNKTAGTFK